MTSACESGPSAWVQSHAGLVKPGGQVLDLAAGDGRHTRYFKGLGYRITALDRDVSRLQDLGAEVIAVDLEDGSPWPLGARDWCRFSVRLARSRAHMIAEAAQAPFEDGKY